jgi:hypothetical protein
MSFQLANIKYFLVGMNFIDIIDWLVGSSNVHSSRKKMVDQQATPSAM